MGREKAPAPMNSSEVYFQKAAEAEAEAARTADPVMERCWRQCAASWREMAEQAARRERDAALPSSDAASGTNDEKQP
jgi:hypothetical protein